MVCVKFIIKIKCGGLGGVKLESLKAQSYSYYFNDLVFLTDIKDCTEFWI